MFEPNKYQKAIFDFIEHGEGNAIVQAVAGSGKTTTLVKALERVKGECLFTAFNKAIARELGTRVPLGVKTATLHSIGLGIIRHNNPTRVTVDDHNQKLRNIAGDVLKEMYGGCTRSRRNTYTALANLCQACLLEGNEADLLWVAGHFDAEIDESPIEAQAEVVKAIIAESDRQVEEEGFVAYGDMIYVPAKKLEAGEWRVQQYPWIFVDETQDLSKAQQIILGYILGDGGRLVSVGDTNQAIYGFRGADAEAMNYMKQKFSCTTLPLSVCYRCPRSHIRMAKALVPQIEAADGAQEGVIEYISIHQLPVMVRDEDLVLCRSNAPLAAAALQIIGQGKKAVIRGGNFGDGLVGLIEKMKTTDVERMLNRLYEYAEMECKRLRERDLETRAQTLVDKVLCIGVLSTGLTEVRDLTMRIKSIFTESMKGVILSSIHRAKGLEANRTFILDPDRMPLTWLGQRDWQYEQEKNIKYVALTRSKHTMYLVRIER